MDEMKPVLIYVDALQRIILDAEEYGECVLYMNERADGGMWELTVVDPGTVQEVRNVLGHLMGFKQKYEGLPEVFFPTTEMMKLKLVK